MQASPDIAARAVEHAEWVRAQMPEAGLFAGHQWRVSPAAFPLSPGLAKEIETLGRPLLQFYRAANLLYRKSAEGTQPAWIADVLDRGKPDSLVQLQRSAAFKNELPRVIRPDLLITEQGISVTELDSVPGGIGLTAWLGRTYSELGQEILGGPAGMLDGFAGMFGDSPQVDIVVSEEAATYRPEMQWLAEQIAPDRFHVRDVHFSDFKPGSAVYRFFEMFDLANVSNSKAIFRLAAEKQIRLTPPPKTFLEEKMLFALLWNRNLQPFWRQELGESFFKRLQRIVPYTWIVDPSPLPPQAAYPELNLTDWQQLKALSQRERELILKVSGFSAHAWGARGVYLGSDLSHSDWSGAVDKALAAFEHTPYILQRYHKPALVEAQWVPPGSHEVITMRGRARLCPYYFVHGESDHARATLGGVLATVCPADKKIIHGMTDAVFAPCTIGTRDATKT